MLLVADLGDPLPLARDSFDAVMALDVVLHLRHRPQAFAEVARVLVAGGCFLFTDAGVITGPVSEEDVRIRSIHGHTQFVPPGCNEHALDAAGMRVLDCVDRTQSQQQIAARRHAVRLAHRAELEAVEGATAFALNQHYLECVRALARRGAMTRMMYVCERPPD